MAETAKLQLFVKVRGRWGAGRRRRGGGALQAPLSGRAEGRVPMAVSAPLPLWWVGSGSPADAEQSRVNPRGRRAKESSLKGLGVACPNPPGSWVQPSPPGEKAPPWGGPDQGASGRGPSGGRGDAAWWGGALGQAARHVSVQVCEAAVPSPPGGLGRLVWCQPRCPAAV